MTSTLFSPPPLGLELATNEIHVWLASLDQPISRFHKLRQTLSMDERIRAQRFYFRRDRKRFIVGRGILRTVLGRYLNVEPARMQFWYGKNGKPMLADTISKMTIFFNMSNSESLALYAFSRDGEIGVDIEKICDHPERDQIADQFFSVRESSAFRALPENKKKEAFFNCWTRKEAFIKAIGTGLSCSLDNFDVSLIPGESAKLLRIVGDKKGASRWSIQELVPASGYAAALAIEGRIKKLNCLQWLE
jgi:4'-phosphopantetheinyl transferase